MRRFITPFAGAMLALWLHSNSLVAQTENQESTEDPGPAVASVQTEDQKPSESLALPKSQTDTQSKPAVPDSPDTNSKTVTSKETVEPKADVQQSQKSADVKAKPGRFALSFDDLKFDQDKGEAFDRKMLTPKINSYHGGKVKIRGYIRPNFKQSGITKFIFVRDNKECCFGPQAAIFDNILVKLDKGESTNYTVRPITVEGDFVLKEYKGNDGQVWSLYRLYNAEVK